MQLIAIFHEEAEETVTGELGSSRTAVPIEDGEVAEIPKPPLCLSSKGGAAAGCA